MCWSSREGYRLAFLMVNMAGCACSKAAFEPTEVTLPLSQPIFPQRSLNALYYLQKRQSFHKRLKLLQPLKMSQPPRALVKRFQWRPLQRLPHQRAVRACPVRAARVINFSAMSLASGFDFLRQDLTIYLRLALNCSLDLAFLLFCFPSSRTSGMNHHAQCSGVLKNQQNEVYARPVLTVTWFECLPISHTSCPYSLQVTDEKMMSRSAK